MRWPTSSGSTTAGRSDHDLTEPLDKIVTFVPADTPTPSIDATGRSRRGSDRRLRPVRVHQSPGTERSGRDRAPRRFSAPDRPIELVAETRVEMVLPRRRAGPVVAALLAAHPYEAPAFDLLELAR